MVRTSEEEEEEEERTYVRQKSETRDGGDGGKARHRHEGLHCTHAPKLSCAPLSLSRSLPFSFISATAFRWMKFVERTWFGTSNG